MTDGIVQDVEHALVLQTALEAGNNTIREIQGGGPALSFYGAHGYEAIRLGLTVSLALTLAKLFDPARLFASPANNGRRRSANKSDIVSIPLLVRLLKQSRCHTFLGKHARGWTPTLAHMETVHEKSAIGAANAAVAAYEEFRRTHEGRSAARVLKIFRNHNLAHRLLDKPAPPPRYRELFLLLDVAAKVAEKARLAVTGVSWDVKDTRDVWTMHSKAFWDPAIRGVIAVERRPR
jgi:AbiU2